MNKITSLPITEIVASKTNRRIDKDQLKELAESIKTHGVLSPVMVRPVNGEHEIVFGERRLRAAKAAGLEEIPVIIREMTDVEALEAQIIENCQRQDIHQLEEADNYRTLHEDHGYPVEEIAAKVGKSKRTIYARIQLCTLAAPARTAFLAKQLTPSTALLIARMPAPLQNKATKDLTTEGYGKRKPRETPMSFREASDLLQRDYMLRLSEAPFPTADAQLVPAASSCTTCPKRTGNQRELFDDVKSADVCTDPGCFKAKTNAQWARIKADAESMGYEKVLSDTEAKKVFPEHHDSPAYKSGYVDLGQTCDGIHYGSKNYGKTYSQLLKEPVRKAEVGITIARDRHGKLRKLLREKDAKAALRKLGYLKRAKSRLSTRSSTSTPASKENPKENERRRQTVKVAIEQIVASVEKRKADAALWRVIAGLIYSENEYDGGKEVFERRQVPARAVTTHIAKAKEPALRGLVVELLLARSLTEWGFWDDGPWGKGFPKELLDVAKYFKVDLKKLEAAMKKLETAAAEELKPKAMSAKRTSPSRKK